MPSIRTLLLALLLPVLVLPEGIVVCLHRLVGEPAPQGCCARYCRGARDTATAQALEMTSNDCANCFVALPTTGRSIDSSAKKSAQDSNLPIAASAIAPPPAPPASFAPPAPIALRFLARAQPAAPPPVPIALPLRL